MIELDVQNSGGERPGLKFNALLIFTAALLVLFCGCQIDDETDSNLIEEIEWFAVSGWPALNLESPGSPAQLGLQSLGENPFPVFANTFPEKMEAVDDQGHSHRMMLIARFRLKAIQNTSGKELLQNQRLAIRFAAIGEHYRIFVNGHMIHDALDRSNSRWRRNLILDIPGHLIHDDNLLVVQLKGQGPLGLLDSRNIHFGIPVKNGFQIGDWHALSLYVNEELRIFLYSIFIFFGLYHFFLFLRRRDDSYNAYFAGFSLSLALYFLAFSNFLFDRVVDSSYLIRIAYGGQALAAACFILFLHSLLFPTRRISMPYRVAFVGDALLVLAALVAPVGFLRTALYLWYPIMFFQIGLICVLCIRALIARLPDARFIVVSILILLSASIWEIVDTLWFFTQIRLVHFGFFILILNFIGLLANRFLRLQKDTERLNVELHRQKNSLARFVPDGFLEAMGTRSGSLSAGAHTTQEMSVLSADLRRFHHYLEGRSASESFRLLNVCLQQMEQAVQFNGGFVDKIMGDEILALFNEQTFYHHEAQPGAQAADMAIQASLDMLIRLGHIGDKQSDVKQPIQAGIGIDSGEITIGAVGGPRFLDTTVMGQSVELAARLERLSGHFDVALLITANTYQRLNDPARYLLREIESLPVPGQNEALSIFEVMDHLPMDLRRSREHNLQAFAHALQIYRSGDYELALVTFLDLNERSLQDSVVEQYVERCRNMLRGTGPMGI